MKTSLLFAAALSFAVPLARSADWSVAEAANTGGPGKQIFIKLDGKPVAGLVHGEGQFKPYLHVYGEQGELLTNGGLDAGGKPTGKFPHHRGIYIGWNKIGSDLGNYDLWHFNNGGKMEVQSFDSSTSDGAATVVAKISWRGGKKDADGSDLLLTETRTLKISRPGGGRTQVDAHFSLKAARDLRLDGDLQHAGIHFRAANEVADRNKETAYVSDPANKEAKSKNWKPAAPKKDKDGNEVKTSAPEIAELKWCRLIFPVGKNWYAATELNAPANPVEELSWRDYGRFGFFFKKSLKQGETLDLDYRFLVEPTEAPAEKAKLSSDQSLKATSAAAGDYTAFTKSLKR